MIFRTESFSAGVFGAPAATIVKAIIKAMAVASAGLFGKRSWRRTDIFTLTDHELRDIGIEHSAGGPIAYDLLDLVPRGGHFSHRIPR